MGAKVKICWYAAVVLVSLVQFSACGEKAPSIEENLLDNGSFERVSDGLPKQWEITNFRGLRDMVAAEYGVTDSIAFDGERSFYFRCGPETRRFYTLTQEMRVSNARRVRIRGAILSKDCREVGDQYPQANFALTYYDANHNRFEGTRFADHRTQTQYDSSDGWVQIDRTFRLPLNTEYVAVHCVLGMSGEMWFDDVSLEIPSELPWNELEGTNFIYHWLDKPYPEGSQEFQQRLFDMYAARLQVPVESRPQISYYLYPDSTTIRRELGLKRRTFYVDYRRRQIHSINPVDDHEIIHMLTDLYGVLPKILSEGTAFYLLDDFDGERVQPTAQKLLLAGELPPLREVLDPFAIQQGDPAKLAPAAASFVGYLIEVGGPSAFLDLHTKSKVDMGYGGFAAAFRSVYGNKLEDAEAAWRRILARADFSEQPTDSNP